jgi:hypothetical protein
MISPTKPSILHPTKAVGPQPNQTPWTQPLQPQDLLSTQAFLDERPRLLAEYRRLSQLRRVFLGPDCLVIFEHRQLVAWQIQEMVRIEKGRADQLAAELAVYGPLEPSPNRLVITLMLQFTDPQVRRERLQDLAGFERHIHLVLSSPGQPTPHNNSLSTDPNPATFPACPVPSQDVYQSTRDKTPSVHFLEINLPKSINHLVSTPNGPASVTLECTHPAYQAQVQVPATAWDAGFLAY